MHPTIPIVFVIIAATVYLQGNVGGAIFAAVCAIASTAVVVRNRQD